MTDKPEKSFFANSLESLDIAVNALKKLKPTKEKTYKIKVTLDTETRRDKQNRLQFWWLKPRADFLGNSIEEERCYCKLIFGCPILLVEDEEFSDFYMKCLNHLTHVEALKAMLHVPVTRIMSVKQFAQYLNDFELDTAKRGLALEQPRNYYFDALMKQEDKPC